MRNPLLVPVALCAAIVLYGLALLPSGMAPAAGDSGPARFDKIEAQEIVVRSRDGRHQFLVKAMDDGVGMWMEERQGQRPCLCFLSMAGQPPYMGLIRHDSKGCPIALTMDEKGRPVMQVVVDGKARFIDLAKLPRE